MRFFLPRHKMGNINSRRQWYRLRDNPNVLTDRRGNFVNLQWQSCDQYGTLLPNAGGGGGGRGSHQVRPRQPMSIGVHAYDASGCFVHMTVNLAEYHTFIVVGRVNHHEERLVQLMAIHGAHQTSLYVRETDFVQYFEGMNGEDLSDFTNAIMDLPYSPEAAASSSASPIMAASHLSLQPQPTFATWPPAAHAAVPQSQIVYM